MITLFLIGRIILGAYFIYSGLNHFTKLGMMAGYAKSKGVPAASLAVAFTGLVLLLGGLSMLFGSYVTIGEICLIIFLLPVTFMMHDFWKVQDPMARMGERINFLKNMALLGAVLMITALPQPWPYSL